MPFGKGGVQWTPELLRFQDVATLCVLSGHKHLHASTVVSLLDKPPCRTPIVKEVGVVG